MKKWNRIVAKYTVDEVTRFAVGDKAWQEFRVSLKGLSTEDKLDKLLSWRKAHTDRRGQVQVDNYINALKRGGQLNSDLEVVK